MAVRCAWVLCCLSLLGVCLLLLWAAARRQVQIAQQAVRISGEVRHLTGAGLSLRCSETSPEVAQRLASLAVKAARLAEAVRSRSVRIPVLRPCARQLAHLAQRLWDLRKILERELKAPFGPLERVRRKALDAIRILMYNLVKEHAAPQARPGAGGAAPRSEAGKCLRDVASICRRLNRQADALTAGVRSALLRAFAAGLLSGVLLGTVTLVLVFLLARKKNAFPVREPEAAREHVTQREREPEKTR